MSKDKKEDKDMETPVVAQPRSFLEVLGINDGSENPAYRREVLRWRKLIEEQKLKEEEEDRKKVNKAEDFIINPILAAALDDIKKETDKAHANMTSQEIFQDLISPTTEDNDDE